MNSLHTIHTQTREAYNLAAQKYHELFFNEMNEKEYDRKLLDAFASKFPINSLICDAGCGPSAHIGRYLFDKGISIVGVDISDRCIGLARKHNPGMQFMQGDLARLPFNSAFFDGIISYYSIVHTPKSSTDTIFHEFQRILRPQGYLLIAVKAGTTEGYLHDFLGFETEIYFSLFTEEEIVQCFERGGFQLEFIDRRNPYDFEIRNERIFAIGRKECSYVSVP
jgi:ubiquinone/menaquinone biosynthesis C-methylase UbiE